MFAHSATRGRVQVAFTDRSGAIAHPDPTADDVRRVVEEFTGCRSAPVALMHQVHGRDIAVLDGPPGSQPPRVDGLATAVAGLTLVVRVADCVPVLLGDPGRGVVGAMHAGREGLAAGIVGAGSDELRSLGAEELVAWVGPHICGRCYEVPAAMREQVVTTVPAAWSDTAWGTPALDIGAGVKAQLTESGVEIVDASRCTREHEDLHSFRRDGERAGRTAGLIRVLEEW